jgi:hypothetical protein
LKTEQTVFVSMKLRISTFNACKKSAASAPHEPHGAVRLGASPTGAATLFGGACLTNQFAQHDAGALWALVFEQCFKGSPPLCGFLLFGVGAGRFRSLWMQSSRHFSEN